MKPIPDACDRESRALSLRSAELWTRLPAHLHATQPAAFRSLAVDIENEVAETILAALVRFGPAPEPQEVMRWSRKCVANKVRSAHRALKLRPVVDHQLDERADACPPPAEVAEFRDWTRELRTRLVDGERHTFDLYRQGVTKTSEIARILGRSGRYVEGCMQGVRRALVRVGK